MTAKEKAKQIKCYCGHTTYCDCGPLEEPRKQTAVEWLKEIYDSCNNYEKFIANIDWEQAKEMEKEQIKDSFGVGCQVESTRLIGYHDMADEYYNETFKSE